MWGDIHVLLLSFDLNGFVKLQWVRLPPIELPPLGTDIRLLLPRTGII